MVARRTRLGSWVPAAVGAVLVVIHVRHVTLMDSALGLLAEAIPPLVVAVGLTMGGVWFARETPDAETVSRVDRWLAAGIAGSLVVGLWTVGHLVIRGDGVDHVFFVLASIATAGAVIGIVLGLYDARARRRQAQVERTRAEARVERDRFAALFENVLNPVAFYEFEGDVPVFRAVNSSFEDVFGYDDSDVRGLPVDEVIVPPERESEASDINDRIRDGEPVQAELRRQTAYGLRDFLVSVVPVSEGTETMGGFYIAIDVTERRRRDRRLQVLNRVLRHDLRNAMNVILGYIDLLEGDEEDVDRAVSVIRARAREMVELSRKARSIEEALHVDERATPVVTDVVPLVRERLVTARSEYPDLSITTEFPDSAYARIRDAELLAAAVDNVVENAVEHADHDDPTLEVRISTEAEMVAIAFADDGPGIPDHELTVLESDEETQLEHLSGLGLWLVNWVVEDADGRADFETGDDGSVVTLRLPRAEETANVADDVWSRSNA